jgi:hypothetical protein
MFRLLKASVLSREGIGGLLGILSSGMEMQDKTCLYSTTLLGANAATPQLKDLPPQTQNLDNSA